jgi:hypothetical protein
MWHVHAGAEEEFDVHKMLRNNIINRLTSARFAPNTSLMAKVTCLRDTPHLLRLRDSVGLLIWGRRGRKPRLRGKRKLRSVHFDGASTNGAEDFDIRNVSGGRLADPFLPFKRS